MALDLHFDEPTTIGTSLEAIFVVVGTQSFNLVEDRRRLCRERKTLTNERVQHVDRIKGLLFSRGISGY